MSLALPQASLPQSIADLIATRKPGYTLPQAFYTDDAIFREDLKRIYFKQWIMVGHVARLPEPGSYFLYQVGDESLIITMTRDRQVNALFNVCRHRGSQICREETGTGKRSLLCPYHAWNFALDGSLLNAPAMNADFVKADHGLRKAHVKVFEGLIFICIADTPPPIDEQFEKIAPIFAFHDLANAKLAARMTWTIRANWKLVTENFAECYHCGPAHPEYCSVMSHALPGTTNHPKHRAAYQLEKQAWLERIKELGTPGPNNYSNPHHMGERFPIGGQGLSQARDGKQVAPLMGKFTVNDGGISSMRIHPANYVVAPCDYAMITRFTPLTAQTTLQEILWLVRSDAREGIDYNPEEVAWLWKVTTDEDQVIIEDNQRGVNSMAYTPGPYAPVEDSVNNFVGWYLKQLQA